MFQSSKDILNLVLSISIIVLSSFLVVAIYYLTASIQKIYRFIKKIDNGVKKIENVFNTINIKLKDGSGYVVAAAEVVKQALGFLKRERWVNKKKVSKKTVTKKK